MDKETVFFSSLTTLIIFEVGYYLMNLSNPDVVWSLGIGAVSSMLLIALTVGIVAGIGILGSGLNDTAVKVALIASSLISLLVQVKIELSWFGAVGDTIKFFFGIDTIPLGIGLLYPNVTNIFITANNDLLSIFGLIIVSSLMLITIVSGLMIAAG
jgi:hypothetical protein